MKRKTREEHLCLWIYVLRFVVLFLPYTVVLCVNRACYFAVVDGTLTFSAAGAICAVVLLMLIFSLPRSSGMLFAFGATFVLCALLSDFLDGATVATGVAFLCRLSDKVILLPLYEWAKERALLQKTTEAAVERVKEELKNDYAGRV